MPRLPSNFAPGIKTSVEKKLKNEIRQSQLIFRRGAEKN